MEVDREQPSRPQRRVRHAVTLAIAAATSDRMLHPPPVHKRSKNDDDHNTKHYSRRGQRPAVAVQEHHVLLGKRRGSYVNSNQYANENYSHRNHPVNHNYNRSQRKYANNMNRHRPYRHENYRGNNGGQKWIRNGGKHSDKVGVDQQHYEVEVWNHRAGRGSVRSWGLSRSSSLMRKSRSRSRSVNVEFEMDIDSIDNRRQFNDSRRSNSTSKGDHMNQYRQYDESSRPIVHHQHEYNLDQWGRAPKNAKRHQEKKKYFPSGTHDYQDHDQFRYEISSGYRRNSYGQRRIEHHPYDSYAGNHVQHDYDQHQAGYGSTQQRSSTAGARSGRSSESHDDTVGHYQGQTGDVISNRYKIVKDVGLGTFGRVLECIDLKRNRSQSHVAIKVVRNIKRYIDSAKIEADIVGEVNAHRDPLNQQRGIELFAEMFSCFGFQGHFCLVFECLGQSLYDYIKSHDYRPFKVHDTRNISQQLLSALDFIHSMTPNPLIHTDLKLENILLVNDREMLDKDGVPTLESTKIKVIDFGGATYDNERKSSIINTRQYRAPEVILQHKDGWSTPSDMWSAACIIIELHQGELLFATHDNVEHLALIEKVCGPFSTKFLQQCRDYELIDDVFDQYTGKVRYSQLTTANLKHVKSTGTLADVVFSNKSGSKHVLEDLMHLVQLLLKVDPRDRATADEALHSAFISRS